jgi:hypothetical protein
MPSIHRAPRKFTRLVVLTCAIAGTVAIPHPAAAVTDIGGGALRGTVVFSNPVPPINTPCRPTDFTFDMSGVISITASSVNTFTGVVEKNFANTTTAQNSGIHGTGHSNCENASAGGGTITVDAITATNPLVQVNKFDCDPMVGNYVRTFTDVTVIVAGQCRVVGAAVGHVSFVVRGEFLPTQPGAGITTPVGEATFGAGFAIVPTE